ncbi:CUE domain-containing protein 1 isoform X2 [Drosophila elegans]|uniref:CUE domain-containing protein 1 isoform X2 n=1 Tax=Drosophila elegans TaxID=30023 RepID=UPI0007E89503|nr:CUE domain-containing protein 1 isoform X2 [Drosophila elegans]
MSTLQLEFSQAMTDFKKMFPDIDREVIEAILRANLGAVDQTIDALLAMSIDNQQSLINLNDTSDKDLQLVDTTDGGGAVAGAVGTPGALLTTSPNHQNTGASPKQRPLSKGSSNSQNNTPTKRTRRWNPPILGPLPAGFLRITPAPGQQDFELPDEQFALMLQNEEFMNQLRWNQDFMNALEKEQSGKSKGGEEDAPFQERLKNMGKMSRKKFLQMARVFTWQRNKKVTTAKQIDSLPLREEPSDDEDHHHHQRDQQQQQQANQQQQSSSQQQGQLQLRK